MSILTEFFPESLIVDGVECLIHSDFRTVLKCNEIIERESELSREALSEILQMFYKDCAFFTEEHIEKMFWFFSCGREKKKKRFPRKIAGLNDKQSFDFEEDAELIYAGFQQQYGIDLQRERMHWWRFMILLDNFGTDTRLSKVMEYRTTDTANKRLGKEERAFLQAMQRYYGLDKAMIVDEQTRRLEEALMNGGDVSGLL